MAFVTGVGTNSGGLWLLRNPKSGTLPANGSLTIAITFDATTSLPGTHTGSLTVSPTGKTAIVIPMTLIVKA